MAKRVETTPRTPTRKIVARQERLDRQNRLVFLTSLAIIVVIALVLIVGSVIEGIIRPNQPVATVGDATITVKEYQARTRYQRLNLVNQYEQTLQFMTQFANEPSFLASFNSSLDQIEFQLDPTTIGREVLNTLIEDELIRQEAAKLGISISESELDKAVEEAFGFFANGTPTATVGPADRPTSTLSPEQFALWNPTATTVPSPTATLDPAATATLEPTVTPTSSDPTATPYTVDGFNTQKKETISNLSAAIRFREADLRALVESGLYREKVYEALTADVPQEQEQVWARHILVADEITALEVISLLNAGSAFAELASTYSTDTGSAARGGDLGWLAKGDTVAEFETAAFALEFGEISAPVQSEFGYHVIQLLGKEVRPVTTDQWNALRQAKFQEWLDAGLTSDQVTILDRWESETPDDPSIAPGRRDQVLAAYITPTAVTPTAPTETPAP